MEGELTIGIKGRRAMPDFQCHTCGKQFFAEVGNEYEMYEFKRCPRCGSAKTTLA